MSPCDKRNQRKARPATEGQNISMDRREKKQKGKSDQETKQK
jgi:hypothetical protein